MDKSAKILKRLELLHPKKIDLSLHRLEKLLKKLNNPHLKIPPIIHVAGTNGKGSVTSFLRSIFEAAKFKVNTYTSPHLIRFNERIRINSKLINNYDLNLILEECEYYNNGDPITFFEITTAAAFLVFSRVNSDITILETGLGGKYDATNVVKNKICSVLTPISMDHMNFLGSSIRKISLEKIGILKNTKIAILSKQRKEVRELVRKEIKKKKVKLYEEGIDWKILNKDSKEKEFNLQYAESNYKFQYPSLEGNHQIENASTAVATVLSLKNTIISNKIINKGLISANWPARMQLLEKGRLSKIIGKKFELWLDGGHNLDAAKIIKKKIELWKQQNVIIVLGMMNGKSPVSFLRKVIKDISMLLLLPITSQNYIQPYEIKNKIKTKLNSKIEIHCSLDINEALRIIKRQYSCGKIIVCGSLYLAGQVLKEDGFVIK